MGDGLRIRLRSAVRDREFSLRPSATILRVADSLRAERRGRRVGVARILGSGAMTAVASTTRTTQAVILARGLGTRMRDDSGAPLDGGQARAAASGAKGMMPFERPFLDYVLSVLADAGITEAVLVIGPPPEDAAIRAYFAATEAGRRVSIRFAVQPEPRGTADALYAARDVV